MRMIATLPIQEMVLRLACLSDAPTPVRHHPGKLQRDIRLAEDQPDMFTVGTMDDPISSWCTSEQRPRPAPFWVAKRSRSGLGVCRTWQLAPLGTRRCR